MSRSPTSAEGSADAYRAGWSAVNKLLRQGHSWSGHEKNCAFLNAGNGTFANVSALSGADYGDDGRGSQEAPCGDSRGSGRGVGAN